MKVGVDLSGIEALRKDLRRLSTRDLKRAVYGALDDVALDANERLARRFRSDIEGGPARFTQIHPGEKRSAVVNNRARREGGSVASSIVVQKRQSRYLRFALGEDDVRTPGEAGFSTKTNLMPTGAKGAGLLTIKRDAQGNVPRTQIRKAFAAVKATEAADRKRLAKKGQEADAKALRAERMKRARKRRQDQSDYGSRFNYLEGSKEAKRSAAAGRRLERAKDGLFMVGKKKGGGLAAGIWQRDRSSQFGKPTLLIAFSQKSRYPHAHLVPGWNDSVRQAADGLAEAVRRRLDASRQGG